MRSNARRGDRGGVRECWEKTKAVKMRPSDAECVQKLPKCDRTREWRAGAVCENAEKERKLPKCDRRILRVSKSYQNATVCENTGQGRRARLQREQMLRKVRSYVRMLREMESCLNATVGENSVREFRGRKADSMRAGLNTVWKNIANREEPWWTVPHVSRLEPWSTLSAVAAFAYRNGLSAYRCPPPVAHVRGQRWIQAIHGWPGPSMDGLTSTVGLAEAGHPWMAWPSPLK